MSHDPPILLDCTLRDGSYAVNFQFTRRDTERLCSALEAAGIGWIEVGHGMGLGASSPRHGIAFETDEVYMTAAAEALTASKWGTFFIPGVGTEEDLARAIDLGMGFVRIGTEVETFESMRPFADQATAADVFTCANLMKTYAVHVGEVGRISRDIASWKSVDCIYLVDSAGCMIPAEVSAYVRAMREASGCRIGFHGHNNLDLANANCLAALDAGASFVDGSIRGMGRSAGNAQTEVLAYLLDRQSGSPRHDCFSLFEAGESLVRPLNIAPQGMPPLDIVIGMARFHTSHLKRFQRYADRFSVDLRRLILSVSAVDCVNPPDSLVESAARDLARMEPS